MRIGIVNDVAMAREALQRAVLSTSEHEIAWMARDGAEAIALARAARPDLILMNLVMAGTDGVEATRRIMGESPCAILVVTATVSGQLSKVYQAMGYGALDAIDTPSFGPRGEVGGVALLLHKIELIGRLIDEPAELRRAGRVAAVSPPGKAPTRSGEPLLLPLVVLGASTGGPQALADVLSRFPAGLEAAVIIVQHVDAAFAPGLGHWLSQQARRKVKLVADGHRPAAGEVLLPSTGDHLIVGPDRCLHYSADPEDACYRPSVNVFFRSAGRNWPRPGVAVLLTGMSHDGALGLLELRRLGWRTIAQDESTSVVWGMPKAAIEMGAAEEVLPLSQIAKEIVSLVSGQSDRAPEFSRCDP